MCGIAGILDRRGRPVSEELLLAMAGELLHRGPDGAGLYLDGAFGMVSTRLAIIDLEGGDQPIGNEDGRYWVMQNGEIYNSPELQKELVSEGHRFASRCDTEVLVHAYEEWGEEMLPRLNGPFAFAIWDRWKRELFVARDRFGVRPLFISEIDGAFIFASEAKAILRHPSASRELDLIALAETFTLWANGPDRSAFVGISELPPGSWIRVGRRTERRTWWVPPFGGAKRSDAAALTEELAALLEDSTKLRLRADVSTGVYLSGGLDSSIVAAMVKRTTGRPPRAFAVRFEDARFDEREQQAAVARAIGAELTSIEVSGRDIARVFPEVVRAAEKPLLRTAPAPLFLLSRAVREHGVPVILTGEGADEVFAGYEIFKEDKVRRFWARSPASRLRPRLLARIHPHLVHDARGEAFARAFFGRGLSATDDPLYSHRIRIETTRRLLGLLHPSIRTDVIEIEKRLLSRLPDDLAEMSPLDRAQQIEIATFMQGYLLHSQGDRMLMAHSIEGRFPFLDHRLIELAAQIDDRLRLRGLREKHLLRRAVRTILPEETVMRPKQPYRAPILRAFTGGDAPEYVRELLSAEHLRRSGIFDPTAASRLIEKCNQRRDTGVGEIEEMGLVGILSTTLLQQLFARQTEAPSATPKKVVVGSEGRRIDGVRTFATVAR